MFNNFTVNSILIDLGPIQIHWYGFLIALAIGVSFLIALKLFKKYNLSKELLYDIFFYGLLGGIIGARLWHVFTQLNYYIANPLNIAKIWNGGLAIHGAVLGGIFAVWLLFRKKRFPFMAVLDIGAPLLALSQAIGRWGNFFNQELYGKPVEWGIPIEFAHRLPGFERFPYFHPTFLYESLWLIFIFAALLVLHRLRLTHDPKSGACPLYHGIIFYIYLFAWSLGRFFIAFLRIDPMFSIAGLRFDQWVSLCIIIITSIILIKNLKNKKTCPVK